MMPATSRTLVFAGAAAALSLWGCQHGGNEFVETEIVRTDLPDAEPRRYSIDVTAEGPSTKLASAAAGDSWFWIIVDDSNLVETVTATLVCGTTEGYGASDTRDFTNRLPEGRAVQYPLLVLDAPFDLHCELSFEAAPGPSDAFVKWHSEASLLWNNENELDLMVEVASLP